MHAHSQQSEAEEHWWPVQFFFHSLQQLGWVFLVNYPNLKEHVLRDMSPC